MNVGDREMLKKDGTLPTVNQEFSTRYMGYMPTVLMIALVVATPLPWRRRAWALLWGLFFTHLFIASIILLMILNLYNHTDWLTLLQLPSFLLPILKATWDIFIYQVAARFFVPVLIWILVTFRSGDLHQMMGIKGDSSS